MLEHDVLKIPAFTTHSLVYLTKKLQQSKLAFYLNNFIQYFLFQITLY